MAGRQRRVARWITVRLSADLRGIEAIGGDIAGAAHLVERLDTGELTGWKFA
jgi:hypothetical protein